MNAIVVVDKNWGIGKDNDLLFRLKKDMAFFRQMTTGKVIVMGANTFRSFPHGALPNRVNVVLDDSGATHPDTVTVRTMAELNKVLQSYATDDVFVVGGASLYKQLIDNCKYAFVTKVSSDGKAQVFFPNLDEMSNWTLEEASEPIEDCDYTIRFCKYANDSIN